MVKVLRSFVGGPLESYVEGFAEELRRRGYSRSSAEQHVCFVAHLDRWMRAAGVGVVDLREPVIERYLEQRRAAGYVEYRSVRALRPVLDHLESLGVLPPPQPAPLGPVDALLERYRGYLLSERGLTARTARGYADTVRPFLAARVCGDGLDLAGLTGAEVIGFVVAACPPRATGSAKLIVCALRSLLTFLHVTGEVPAPLVAAVPPVAGHRMTGLPKGLEPDQLRRLLASCDRRRATGRRDYAILLVLCRLGLRAGEVAALGLDDIDWRAGEVVVRGKGNRVERLPLPADVGAAVAGYLRRGRPTTAQGRSVFVRVHAPHRALTTSGVTMAVFAAGQRAGLGKIHAHRLRHTAATELLRAGGSLAEVGQVLRHRSALTTAIYAKVDRAALAVLARPWPVDATAGVS